MTKKKDTSGDFGFGEILLPIIELMTMLVLKLMQLLGELISFLWQRYVCYSPSLEKIERSSLGKKKTTVREDAIGYSVTNKRQVLGSDLNKSAHTAIAGASGSGKTVLLDALMFEDMRQGKPVVYIDPKGDAGTMNNFIRMCKFTGREFAIFSENYHGEAACALNPVKDGTPSNIADRIHHAFTWTEEYYAQLCREALETAIDGVIFKKKIPTLENIHQELVNISKPDSLGSLYKEKDVRGLISRLQKLRTSDFGDKLKGKEALSFKDIRESKKCVYIGLSVLGYAEVARSLGRIILGDMAYCAYQIYKQGDSGLARKSSMGITIDELSAVITEEFIEILNKARGAGMEITFAFQSPSDLSKLDKHLCLQILENASNWFIFKQRLEEGSKIFSQAMGTLESTKQTVRIEDGEEQALGSQRRVEEFIVHPNIIKNLNVGQCILLRHFPTRIDLLNIKHMNPRVLKENLDFLQRW